MKNLYRYLLLASALLLFIPSPSSAQQHLYRWRIGAFAGASTYYGDLNTRLLAPTPALRAPQEHPQYWLRGIHLQNSFTRALSWRITAATGRLQANDRTTDWAGNLTSNTPYFDRALNVETRYQQVGLSFFYDFNDGHLLDLDALVAPYFGLGAGFMRFQPYADLYTPDGTRYHYWSDGTIRDAAEGSGNLANRIEQDNIFETALADLQTEGIDYPTQTLYFPLTLGLKFRLNDRLHLNLEGNGLYTLTDYLDDVSGDYPASFSDPAAAYASNPSERSGTKRGTPSSLHDIVGQLSIGLYVNFGVKTYDFLPPAFLSTGGQQFELTPIGLSANAGDTTVTSPAGLTTYDDIFKATNVTNSYRQNQAWQDTLARLSISPVLQPATQDDIRRKAFQSIPADTLVKVANDTIIDFQIDANGQFSPIDTTVILRQDTIITLYPQRSRPPQKSDESLRSIPADTLVKVVNDTIIDFQIDANGQFSPIDTTVILRQDTIITLYPQRSRPPQKSDESLRSIPADTLVKVVNDTIIDFQIDANGQFSPIDTTVILRQDTITYAPDTMLQQVERSRLAIARLQQRYQSAVLSGNTQERQTDSLTSALNLLSIQLDEYRIKAQQQQHQDDRQTDAALQSMNEEIAYLKQQLAQPALGAQRAKALAEAEKAASDAKIKALEDRIKAMEEDAKQPAPPTSAPTARNRPVIVNRSRLQASPRDSLSANADTVGVAAPVTNDSAAAPTVAARTDSSQGPALQGALYIPKDDDAPAPAKAPAIAAPDTALQRQLATQQAALAQKDDQIATLQQRLARIEQQLTRKDQQTRQVEQQLKSQLDTLNVALAAVQAAQRQLRNETQSAQQRAAALQGIERSNVYFPSGSVAIARDHQLRLQEVARVMAQYPELVASITGYADKSGNPTLNAQLSQRRAEAVKAYLVAQGIDASRLTASYEGEMPAAKANDPFARRVEVVVR